MLLATLKSVNVIDAIEFYENKLEAELDAEYVKETIEYREDD